MICCPHCGSTDLIGGRYFRLIVPRIAQLPCICGASADGVAAIRRTRVPITMQEWGRFGEDGDREPEWVEEVERSQEETDRTEVNCPNCVANASRAEWVVADGPPIADRRDQTPFLACNGCTAEYLIT